MEITYRVLGSDGKEYGPVTQPQLQSWINDGRLLPESQVSRSDDGPWRQAAQFVELHWSGQAAPATAAAASTPAAAPTTATVPVQGEMAGALERQTRSGAGWFYWIAGLSAVNTVSAIAGGNFRFVIGLSITQVFDVIAVQAGVAAIAIVLSALVLAAFVLFGVFANKRHLWAFIVGIVLYSLDAILSLVFQDWINLAFHVFALFGLISGMKAAMALNKLSRAA
jgi:hypothetical protein